MVYGEDDEADVVIGQKAKVGAIVTDASKLGVDIDYGVRVFVDLAVYLPGTTVGVDEVGCVRDGLEPSAGLGG